MKTKTIVVVLAVLGVAAALRTAVLAASLRIDPIKEIVTAAPKDTKVLIAARDVPAMSVTKLDDIAEKTIAIEDAPENYFTDPIQIAGKIIILAMVEGQPFIKTSFAREGSGTQLAGHLGPNMRAMTIQLGDGPGLASLLYPGSIVDILVSFKVSVQTSKGEAVSTTLLKRITVLAVDTLTMNDPSGYEEAAARSGSSRSRRRPLVTLLVNSRQAKALQLAMLYGQISLAMRNPRDIEPIDDSATLLSQGQMARLADTLGISVSSDERQSEEAKREFPMEKGEFLMERAPFNPSPILSPKPPPSLDIEVYRGSALQIVTFAHPTT